MIVNNENDRRLSNGIMAELAASSTDGAVDIGDKTSDTDTLARSFTQRPASFSPPEISLSPSASSQDGRRSTTGEDNNERESEGSGIAPPAAEPGASSPAVSTRSSGASSAETQLDGGGGGDRTGGSRSWESDETTDGNSTDGSGGSDIDSISLVREKSATSSVTTVCEGGDASQEAFPLVCPAPSLAVEEQRRPPQARGHGDGTDKKGNQLGGRREVGTGSVSAAARTAIGASSTIVRTRANQTSHPTTPTCKQPLPTDDPKEPATTVTTAKTARATTAAAAKTVATSARTRSQQHSTTTALRKPPQQQHQQHQMNHTVPRKWQQQSAWAMKPTERRPLLSRATCTAQTKLPCTSTAAKKTKAGKTVKTPAVGQPTEKSKAKQPVPRPKGTGSGRRGRRSGGGSGRHVAGSDNAGDVSAGGCSISSPDKRLTPRVSASRAMVWERSLRAAPPDTPSKSMWDSSPGRSKSNKKKNRSRRAVRKAKNGGGNDGYGGGQHAGTHDDIGGGRGEGEDGRPSVGTWEKTKMHLRILMEHTGKDEEELKWLTVAGNGGGIAKSENEREAAETDYHRLLFEESMQAMALKLLNDGRLEAALLGVSNQGGDLESVAELLEELAHQDNNGLTKQSGTVAAVAVASSDTSNAAGVTVAGSPAPAGGLRAAERERAEKAMTEAETRLKQLLEDIGTGQKKLRSVGSALKDEYKRVSGRGKGALDTVVGIITAVSSARELIAPDRAKIGLCRIKDTTKTITQELRKTRGEAQSALELMEKWRVRHEELPEFGKETADKEKRWLAREGPANEQARQRMRALIPVDVSSFTVAELKHRAVELGSLYPHELALRLKENRLLQWIVMHPDDIARTNFLKGSHAHFYTNLDQYDVVEMRAILSCLPAKFEADGDGKKAAWRAGFFQRVQSLVAQERGDVVSGGWDPATSARRTVHLPKLSAEQARKKEYFYPTAKEVEQKTQKLLQRQRRLADKQAKLAQVKEVLLPEAKAEYSNVLEDTRHPANKEAFTPEDLRRARDEAKAEVNRFCKEARRLEAEVSSAQRVLRESPYTLESLRAEAEATRRLLSDRATKLRLLVTEQQDGQEQQEQGKASAAGPKEDDGSPIGAVYSLNEEKKEPDMEVAEGPEVEGAFDPTPEIKSRFADKSASLRFVTPEEDKRKRREEMAAVFADRDGAAATGPTEHESGGGSSPEGRGAAEAQGSASALIDVGHAKSLTKALGSRLEKQLTPRFFARAAPPGSAAAAAAVVSAAGYVGRGTGAKVRVGTSPPTQRQQQRRQQRNKKATTIPTPRFEPKSKFFRSILTSPLAADTTSCSTYLPPRPPPLPPMMSGLLEQIRAGGSGSGVVPPPPPPPVHTPLPHAPTLRLAQRSLFATTAGPSTTAASVQGAPDGMFAELKAKTAARLRRAAEAKAEAEGGAI